MNHYTRWAFALALLPVAACSSNTTPAMSTPNLPAISAADQTFVNAAASTDAAEMQASQMATTKARSTRIKQYAAKMVADHTQTTQQLTTIAQSKSIVVSPTAPDPAMLAKLDADKSVMFDRDYMRDQVNGHMMAVQAYQDEIANGSDADLKAFAQQTLPTIQQHLTMARQISGIREPTMSKVKRMKKMS